MQNKKKSINVSLKLKIRRRNKMDNLTNLIKLKNTVTGEIKLFSGPGSAHIFMKENQDWLVWSA